MLVVNRRHLELIVGEYIEHYNRERPHRGLDLATPVPDHGAVARGPVRPGSVRRRGRLGGLISEYHADAA